MSKRRYVRQKKNKTYFLLFFYIIELERRINNRIKSMLDRGLIDELAKFHDEYNRTRTESEKSYNYTTGIFQAIGFKEFHDYLLLSDIERKSEQGEKVFANGR
jgi:tRNA A37 N6-isopentenylltransferase MiaA